MTAHRHEPIESAFASRAIAPSLSFSIVNWCAWAPGRPTRAAWCAWAGVGHDDGDAASAQVLPPMIRRRLSPFGQHLLSAILTCAEGLPAARYVLSTRHGELSRAVKILRDIETENLPSPTDFSMAIHHALLGMLSIHADNRLGHTALSSGWESFAAGMLEAALCIHENPSQPVILIHADEPLPAEYEAFREHDDVGLPVIVALTMGPPIGKLDDDISLQLAPHSTTEAPSPSMVTDFLQFFLSKEASARAIGRRSDWVWHRGA